ncbi:MAG: helix-turn-helix transcriptional regulator [Gemmatimonadales bacterium]
MSGDDSVRYERFYEAVGARVRAAREGKLTQAQLAQRVGMTRSSIANFERGKQRVLLHTLVLMARCLDARVDELLPPDGLDPAGAAEQEEQLATIQPQLEEVSAEVQDFVRGAVRKSLAE